MVGNGLPGWDSVCSGSDHARQSRGVCRGRGRAREGGGL